MDIAEIWKYELRKGSSSHPANGACLFDAGMWLVYGKIGDNPPCACPIIRAYGIGLNDRMNGEHRQLLKPFILRIVGNRDPQNEEARLHKIVLETARRIVPLTSNLLAFQKLRDLPDNANYNEIKTLCDAARDAADAAADADADAAAYAAYAAARTAYAAVRAAAYAAAYAAANAAAVWEEAVKILDEALKIGKQSPEFDEESVRRSVHQFELARSR